MLTKRLTQVGNSVGLILDRTLLDLLSLEPGSEVQVEIDQGRLIVSPLRRETTKVRTQVLEAHKRVMSKHAGTFRKLAK